MLRCEYWLRNKQHRESTLTSDPEEAQDFLDHRLMELGADVIGARQFIPPSQRKMRVAKLLDDLEADYVLRNKASRPFLSHLKAIRAAFAEWPAVEVTRPAVDRYIIAERGTDGGCHCEPPLAATLSKHSHWLFKAVTF